jgi:hypothetical protein
VAARFHVKKLLTAGSSAGLVESMFSFTFRHETPTDTMHRISAAVQTRYTGRPYFEQGQSFCQHSEMVRLHDLVVRDLLLCAGESLDDYLDVYQVETFLRRLCGGGGSPSSSSSSSSLSQQKVAASSAQRTNRARSNGDCENSRSDRRSAAPSSQQLLSIVIKTLAPRGVCFGDGPRYRADVVKQVFWAVLHPQFPRASAAAVVEVVPELDQFADLERIGADEYWSDLWDS